MSLTARADASHEAVLHNGLRIVVVPYAAAPVATLLVLYRVGARNEAVGSTGSSHLLEHMLFKGTHANNRANGRAFADIMNEIGANKNATTWIDRTTYYETVPVEFLPLAIELEADRMRNALIADADRRSEMTVVRNELERSDNDPQRVLATALVASAFREHPYHHPTIGWRSDVEGVSTQRLRELYDTYYHPGNATVFVVGDVEVAPTRALIERHFGELPPAPLVAPEVYTSEPPQLGERVVTLRRPGDDTLFAYAFHAPAAFGQLTTLPSHALAERVAAGPPREVEALAVLGRVLGRGRTSRLARALVDERFALDVAAWNWGSRDPGLFEIVVTVNPGVALERVRAEVDRVLAALAERGPEPDELERARAQIAAQRAFARDGTLALAQRLAEFEAVGSWHLDDDAVERVAAVTADDVRDVVRNYVHEDNRTVGTLVPGAPRTFVAVAFEPVEEHPRAPSDIASAPLPRPQPLAARRFADRIVRAAWDGVQARYVASPHTATLHVRGLIVAGPAFAPDRPMLASIVAEMLARGTRRQERHALDERLERAGIRRAYYVDDDRSQAYDPLAFRFVGACTASEAPLLLETLAEELREPAFLPDELELVKAELAGGLRLARTSTGWRSVQRFLQLAYEPGDPNAEPDLDVLLTDVESVDVAAVRDYYERCVLVAPAFLSAAGSLSPEAFQSLAARTVGTSGFGGGKDSALRVTTNGARSTPSALPLVRPQPARAVRSHVALERKASADIVLGRATDLVRASEHFLAAALANGILGQSTLSSRLGLQVRDREGLTYGVTSAFLSPGRLPGPWRVGVTVNPANVERAIASVRAVVRAYVEHGPTERELVQQRHSMAGSQRVALGTNAGIAQQLERLAYHGLGDDDVDTYRERLEAVSRADVHTAAARYVRGDDLIVVTAGSLPP